MAEPSKEASSTEQPKVYCLLNAVGSRRWPVYPEPDLESQPCGRYVNGAAILAEKESNGWLQLADEHGWVLKLSNRPAAACGSVAVHMGWKQVKQCDEGMQAVMVGPKQPKGECALCADKVKEGDLVINSPCGHKMHADCLKDFFKDSYCPACSCIFTRRPLPTTSCPPPEFFGSHRPNGSGKALIMGLTTADLKRAGGRAALILFVFLVGRLLCYGKILW